MDIPTISTSPFTNMAATGLYTYELLVIPDAGVRNDIRVTKQSLAHLYAAPLATEEQHMLLASFMAKEAMESTLIRWMHRIISTHKSFRVTLQGFGALSSKLLYLRVQEQQPFVQLAAALQVVDQYIRSNDCPPLKRFTHPYLPLTRTLSDTVFEAVAAAYTGRHFQASFDVKELVLVRKQHELDAGQQVNVFGLIP